MERSPAAEGSSDLEEPREAPLGEATAALAEYLADLNIVSAALVTEQATLGPVGDVGLIAQMNLAAVAVVETLDPPPEATDLHEQWLSLFGRIGAATQDLAAALDSGDQARVGTASTEFSALIGDISADIVAVGRLQSDLETQVLQVLDTPEAAYLLEVRALQEDSALDVEKLFGAFSLIASDPLGAVDVIAETLESTELSAAGLEALDPPASLAELHASQVEVLEGLTSVFAEVADTVRSARTLEPALVDQLTVLSARSQFDNAAMSRAAAVVLGGDGYSADDLAADGSPVWAGQSVPFECTVLLEDLGDRDIVATHCLDGLAVQGWDDGDAEGWALFSYDFATGWSVVSVHATDDTTLYRAILDAAGTQDGTSDSLCAFAARFMGRSPSNVCVLDG